MKKALFSFFLFATLISPVSLLAQRTPRKPASSKPAVETPRQPPPEVRPTPTPAPPPTKPFPVVVVKDQTISTSEFEADLRQEVESVDYQIALARASILDLQINTTLLQVEAKKRSITPHRLYELEVLRKIPVPPPAQVKRVIDDNPTQFAGMSPALAERQVLAYLHDQFEGKLADDLVKRLRVSNPVQKGVDVNSPNLAPEAIVATIGGQPVRAAELNERLKPIIYKIKLTAYELVMQRANQMVDDLLLLAEAGRRNIGPEAIIRTEITEKIKRPTDAEITSFYNENKARINGDLNSVRNQVVGYLQAEDQVRLEKQLSDRLRKDADIRWLISAPAQPVQNISVDDDPSRGPANALVTVVEFTDFQCPACAAMHPVLEEVLNSYGTKVRFVVRDFPLTIHPEARKAAEAANAAKAQGKFFEYAAILFKRQSALDVPSLKKYASELGLDRTRFDGELDRGIYEAEVKHDLDDGEIYGVGVTPTIFVNGVQLRILSADALREAIDKALGTKSK
jgi:protein-disulfide isomerase